jgi:PAS domain S-box-containing protein
MTAATEAMHPLLRRLVRKVGASAEEAPSLAAWQALLALVSRTYHDADQDRYTLERSIEISSREMQGLYEELKRRSEHELASSAAILRATLEAANDGIIVASSQREVLAANERFFELSGLPRELGSGDHRVLSARLVAHAGLPPETVAEIDAVHASDVTVTDEVSLPGGKTFARFSAPVELPDGGRVGRVTFFRDVTAERQARREIEAAREAAEAASQAKSLFLASMSHELRTPLNAVIGLADLLVLDADEGERLTAQQREYVEGIAESGRHLLALVNDVLDLAKIEAGKQELELEEVALEAALEEGAAALVPLAQHRDVALVVEHAAARSHIRADRLRLRQVLYNLISNAVKFTSRGGRVAVRTRSEGARVAIEVADTGIGIAPEDLPRLYVAFEQMALPSGDRPAGTGLGLALTKRLVEMHGGTIDVASRRGVGTTFTVWMEG